MFNCLTDGVVVETDGALTVIYKTVFLEENKINVVMHTRCKSTGASNTNSLFLTRETTRKLTEIFIFAEKEWQFEQNQEQEDDD